MLANQLDAVCKMLDINQEDTVAIEILSIIFEHAEHALQLLIDEDKIPKQLEWVVNEVAIKRYQQIGAEHLQSEHIDAISNTFIQGDLFADYLQYINAYIANKAGKRPESFVRRVRFY